MTFLTLGYAGLRTAASPPGAMENYRASPDRLDSFEATVEALTADYGAATRDVAYWDEETEEWVKMAGHAANINPAWEGAGRPNAPKHDAGWTTVTAEYDPVRAADVYVPLIEAIEDRGVTGGAFGAFQCYRLGGEVHGDLFLPAMSFTLDVDGTAVEYVPGIQTGYSHYGDQKVYAEPVVLDPRTGAAFRHLTDKRTRRHVKPREGAGSTAADVAAWWDNELERLEYMGSAIVQVIDDARSYTVSFDGLPFGPADFYTGLGFPEAMAEDAADPAKMAPHEQSAWALFQSIAHELAHGYEGKLDGRALRKHFRRANDILFRPAVAEERVLDAWADRDEADQTALNGPPVRDTLMDRKAGLTPASEYRTLKDRVKTLAEAAEEEAEA